MGLQNYVSIDPGLNGTGWAVWQQHTFRLLRAGNISKASSSIHWLENAEHILNRINHVCNRWHVRTMWIEQPAFHGSAKGEMVARRGDLVKLVSLFGMIYGRFHETIDIEPVEVMHWKGQLPKAVVEQRVRALIPCLKNMKQPSHVWDAIGIGLYKKGVL